MYEDEKYQINWLKLFLVLLIAFLVVILSIKLISIIIRNRDSKGLEVKMQDNLQLLDETAKKYLKEERLPKKVGNTNKYSLQKLVDEGIIEILYDEKGNECNMSSSYIEATRLETEYQIKSYLICNGESNYTNSFVPIEEQERIEDETIIIETPTSVSTDDEEDSTTEVIIIEPKDETTTTITKTTTTTSKATTKKTTKEVTTTKKITTTKKVTKTYKVEFNTNGGDLIDPIQVEEGDKIPQITPVRNGFKFIGWYYHGEPFDLDKEITSDYVLVAKWVKN